MVNTGQDARRPLDASMGLLREVMERPLDPGYAIAAQRRRTGGARPSPVPTFLLAAALAALTVVAVVTLRTPSPDAVTAREGLEREIDQRSAAVERLQASNAATRQQIAQAQAAQLQRQGGRPLVDRAERLGVVSGELPVRGSGVELTIDDAPGTGDTAVGVDPREDADTEQGRVLDRDLQIVVNGLWAAGAEAVSVNGQRLTSLSAIRSAGQAILVDFRPLVPPYVVQAVGDPAGLQAGFAADAAGPYVQSLRDNYDIRTSIGAEDRLELPGAGQVSLRYASATATTTSSPPSSPSPSAGGTAGLEAAP